jgi:hypothetical protein
VHDGSAVLWFGNSSLPAEDLLARHQAEWGTMLVVEAPIADALAWRIVDGALVARQVMAPTLSATSFAADGVASVTLSGLPEGCDVLVMLQRPVPLPSATGPLLLQQEGVTSGSITLTSDKAGQMRITVTCGLEYAPWEGTVEAV